MISLHLTAHKVHRNNLSRTAPWPIASQIITAVSILAAITSPNGSAVSAFSRTSIHQTAAAATRRRSNNLSSTSRLDESLQSEIKYLGSGPDAIVRPGVVLVAPDHEYDHFLMKSAVFVYAIGLDDNQDMVIRGNNIWF